MDYEIHEQILLYLFENRDTDKYYDLLEKFTIVPRQVLHDRVEELKNKNLIDVQYPFYGGFILDVRTGETKDMMTHEDFIKAKIRTDGIDHVKNKILMKITDDEIIDKILNLMADKEQHSVQGQIAKHFHLIDNTHDRIRERMIRKQLIRPYTKDGEIITDFGMDVIDEGGWLKFKEIQDQSKPKESNPTIIHTGDIGTIQTNYGTVNGAMTQSSDSSQNKITNTPAKANSSIIKKILIGVAVGLIVALVLYYFFGIKN